VDEREHERQQVESVFINEDPGLRTFDRSTLMTDYERLGADKTKAEPANPMITELSVISGYQPIV